MFSEVHHPESLGPKELDYYLADGWFRMGQTIFTTNFLRFKGIFYSAIWLRIDLTKYSDKKNFKKLAKLNSKFRVEINKACVTLEKENLFDKYKSHIAFEAASSIEHLLYHDGESDIYDTYEVCIYDFNRLIAIGFFDIGNVTGAGISCIYDPEYKKYSLGKYLMYLKMEYMQEKGLEYFYPGYFAPDYPLFDYKLNLVPQCLEYLDVSTDTWKDFLEYEPEEKPIYVIEQKLEQMISLLESKNIAHKLYRYEFFDANLMRDIRGLELFDFPMFIECFEKLENGINPILVFDVRDQNYHLLQCMSIFKTKKDDNLPDHVYADNLLKTYKYLFSCTQAEMMATILAMPVGNKSA